MRRFPNPRFLSARLLALFLLLTLTLSSPGFALRPPERQEAEPGEITAKLTRPAPAHLAQLAAPTLVQPPLSSAPPVAVPSPAAGAEEAEEMPAGFRDYEENLAARINHEGIFHIELQGNGLIRTLALAGGEILYDAQKELNPEYLPGITIGDAEPLWLVAYTRDSGLLALNNSDTLNFRHVSPEGRSTVFGAAPKDEQEELKAIRQIRFFLESIASAGGVDDISFPRHGETGTDVRKSPPPLPPHLAKWQDLVDTLATSGDSYEVEMMIRLANGQGTLRALLLLPDFRWIVTKIPPAGAEEGVTRRDSLGMAAGMAAAPVVTMHKGLFEVEERTGAILPDKLVRDSRVGTRLKAGEAFTIKVEVDRLPAAPLRLGRLFAQKGAAVPSAWRNLPRILLSDDPEEAVRQLGYYGATRAEVLFLSEQAMAAPDRWGKLFQGRWTGVYLSPEALETLELLIRRDPKYLDAFLAGLKKAGGFFVLFSIEVDEAIRGGRRLYLYA